MDITNIYRLFPTEDSCIEYLEEMRWGGVPRCPYCSSTHTTPAKKERRHYCRYCKTSFSVTINTPFHHSHVDLRKWFLCAVLVGEGEEKMGARKLGRLLGVNKNTAWSMVLRIKIAMMEHRELLTKIGSVLPIPTTV